MCVNAHHYRFAEPISNIIKWFPFPPLRLMSDMEEEQAGGAPGLEEVEDVKFLSDFQGPRVGQ